jgi:hypothetical protein
VNSGIDGAMYRVIASPASPVIRLVSIGIQGPAGVSGGSYTHEQNIPASTWVVNHNLGYKPNIRVKNSAGDYVIAYITDTNNNTSNIIFEAANSGEAYCS